jgi:DNA primase large subunit
MDELEFALKFPFTDEARALISNMQLSERIIEMGAERVKKALKGESAGRMVINESEIKEEIASFAAARMILGSLRNQFITNRFAVNESKMVRNHLDKADDETIKKVSSRFGISPEKDMLDIPTYLKFSPRDRHYRLINKKIINGKVFVRKAEEMRLIEEAVKKHIENIPVVRDVPQSMKKVGESILEELPKTQTRINVKEGDHPPCIMNLFESIKKHENLPHTARWYLATYLLAINMSDEQITAIFSGVPDFSEKTTRYQVAHARKKGYSVPACSTVMSYGLCTAVCRIGSPLRWHSLSEMRKKEVRR